ncbi:MAG: GGDEF domain-containing protein [Planctomycetes bacterium]|nr:GGDEF domain-containing protein [Planctomycetota bacterium]
MDFKEVCQRLLGACHRISGSWSLEEGLSGLAHTAFSLLKPRAVAILLLTDHRSQLKIVGSHGLSATFINHANLVPDDPSVAQVLDGGRDILVESIDTQDPAVGALRLENSQGSLIATPIAEMNRPAGLVVATSDQPGHFTAEHQLVLQLVSRLAAACHGRCQLYDERRRMMTVDPVTGLWSFEFFCTRLNDEIARSRRHGQPLSLLLIEIDNFIRYKRTHGQEAADELFGGFVDAVRVHLRGIDFLGRFGLDDVLVALPETDARGAAKAGERILEALRTTTIGPRDSRVTASIGVTALGSDDSNATLLLERAQRALYSAHLQGMDCLRTEA